MRWTATLGLLKVWGICPMFGKVMLKLVCVKFLWSMGWQCRFLYHTLIWVNHSTWKSFHGLSYLTGFNTYWTLVACGVNWWGCLHLQKWKVCSVSFGEGIVPWMVSTQCSNGNKKDNFVLIASSLSTATQMRAEPLEMLPCGCWMCTGLWVGGHWPTWDPTNIVFQLLKMPRAWTMLETHGRPIYW